MNEDLSNLAERLILSGELIGKISEEYKVKVASVLFDGKRAGINLAGGIEKLINGAGIKCVNIEDGIVRCEFCGIDIFQYVLPEDRKRVFEELRLF